MIAFFFSYFLLLFLFIFVVFLFCLGIGRNKWHPLAGGYRCDYIIALFYLCSKYFCDDTNTYMRNLCCIWNVPRIYYFWFHVRIYVIYYRICYFCLPQIIIVCIVFPLFFAGGGDSIDFGQQKKTNWELSWCGKRCDFIQINMKLVVQIGSNESQQNCIHCSFGVCCCELFTKCSLEVENDILNDKIQAYFFVVVENKLNDSISTIFCKMSHEFPSINIFQFSFLISH